MPNTDYSYLKWDWESSWHHDRCCKISLVWQEGQSTCFIPCRVWTWVFQGAILLKCILSTVNQLSEHPYKSHPTGQMAIWCQFWWMKINLWIWCRGIRSRKGLMARWLIIGHTTIIRSFIRSFQPQCSMIFSCKLNTTCLNTHHNKMIITVITIRAIASTIIITTVKLHFVEPQPVLYI